MFCTLKIFILFNFVSTFASEGHDTEEYCISETFRPSCLTNEVIILEEASFGRKKLGRCLENEGMENNELNMADRKFIGCYSDVRGLVEPLCSLRKSCEVRVVELNAEVPCYKYLRYSLEIRYSCVRVGQENRQCKVNVASEKQHILVSHLTTGTCGSKDHPWTIESLTGQKITISTTSFPYVASNNGNMSYQVTFESQSSLSQMTRDNEMGYILDRTTKKRVMIKKMKMDSVGSDKPKGETFVSDSNNVEIVFNNLGKQEKTEANFLLSLEAMGCSDLIPPADAWLKRTENEATIGCYSTRMRWQLKCIGQRWIGVIGNCSQGQELLLRTGTFKVETSKDSQVVVIFTIIVSGTVLCLLITCLGIVLLKRYYAVSKSKALSRMDDTYKTENATTLYNDNPILMATNSRSYCDSNLKKFIGVKDCGMDVHMNQNTAQYYELDQSLVNKESLLNSA